MDKEFDAWLEAKTKEFKEHLANSPVWVERNALLAQVEELKAEAVLRRRDHDKDRTDRNLCRTFIGNIAALVGGDDRDLSGLHSLLKAKLDIRKP